MNKQEYIHGSNARALSSYEEVNKKTTKRVEKTKKAEVKVKQRGLPTIMLGAVIVVTIATLAVLLKVQFIVNDQVNKNIRMHKELVDLRKTNQKLESEIEKSINMNEIYERATNELGMIRPTQDNIRYIHTEQTAYTVQYIALESDLKEQGINFGDFLGFISEGW